PVAHLRLAPQFLASPRRTAARKGVVDEHDTVADEAILADADELADETVRLHARAGADDDVLLYLGERPDEAAVADRATVEITGFDDLDAGAETDVVDTNLVALAAHEAMPRRLRRGMKWSDTSCPVSMDS